jgi:hypothetical protein
MMAILKLKFAKHRQRWPEFPLRSERQIAGSYIASIRRTWSFFIVPGFRLSATQLQRQPVETMIERSRGPVRRNIRTGAVGIADSVN